MRRPNIRSAGADIALVLFALAAGWAGAGLAYLAALFVVAAAVWTATRRDALAAMGLRTRLINAALALLMYAVVLGLFYWMGRMAGGHN